MKSKYLVIILAFILILCVNTVSAADNSSILSVSPDSDVLTANEGNYVELKDLNDSNITQGNTVLNLGNDNEYYSDYDDVGSLNVTKVTEEYNFTDVGEYLTFVVNITNTNNVTLHNITIIEEVPECFDSTFEAEVKSIDADVTVDGNKITYSKELKPNEHVEVYIRFQAIKAGIYINNITVTSNETIPAFVQSNRFTVYDPKINFTKTAVNKTVISGNQAVFLINVTNTGDRPLRPEEISVNDYWPKELIYDHIENVTGEWSVIDYLFPVFALNSILDVNKSVSFKIYFNTTEFGKFENLANIFFHLGEIYEANDNVDVVGGLNVTKVTEESNFTDVGEYLTFVVNITNVNKVPIHNITIIEDVPECFDSSFEAELKDGDADVTVDGNKIIYSKELKPNENVEVYIKFHAIKAGSYINNITVTSSETIPAFVQSNRFTVYNPKINFTKTAVNKTVISGNQAVFVINVTNTGDRPLRPEEISVNDYWPEELIYDHIENVTGEWSVIDYFFPVFALNSILEVNESVNFKIYFNTTKIGKFENRANVFFHLGNIYEANDTVSVVPKISVKISVDNVTAYPGDEVSIPIVVTADDGTLFNGNLTVTLPDGSTQNVEIIGGKGNIAWTIPMGYEGDYPITASFEGNNIYLPANGTGFITVIPDTPVTPDDPVNPETPVNPDAQVNPETPENPSVKAEVPMDNKATGNPLIALLMVLALLGIRIKRKN